ncbi:MAG: hypothetical protein JWL84_164 [Rhodospirillales bacterium]|nr:hypothetical protein [Rhodospirillales bacterium]
MKNDRNPISKALKVLGWLAENPSSEAGVREVAAGLQISPSSAHRLLLALAEEGFVQQNSQTSQYSLGLEFFRLAQLTTGKAPIRQAALEPMRHLVDACNETALLGIYNQVRQEMMFAASVESGHSLRYVIELNKWMPVHTGASGLAIMAFLSETEIQSIIHRTRLAPLTGRSITESYRIVAELENVRQRGFAFTRGQRIPGAVGLAAPMFGSSGEVLGDICLTIPEQRFDDASKDHLVDLLVACADRITSDIGGRSRQRAA